MMAAAGDAAALITARRRHDNHGGDNDGAWRAAGYQPPVKTASLATPGRSA